MLRRRTKPKMGVRERPQIRSPGHLSHIRGFECAVAKSGGCEGRIEACHVRTGTDGNLGTKPSDSFTVPLCSGHHRQQHNISEGAFEALHKIDMKKIAADLWRRSPHRLKLERQK